MRVRLQDLLLNPPKSDLLLLAFGASNMNLYSDLLAHWNENLKDEKGKSYEKTFLLVLW